MDLNVVHVNVSKLSGMDVGSPDDLLARGRSVIAAEAEAIRLMGAGLGDQFVAACHVIHDVSRQLVVTGMGKSGHIARKVAATFAATGTPAIYIHPAEAGHGDLGMLMPGDVLLVLSNSGSTSELHAILNYARGMGVPIIGVAAREKSLVIREADLALVYPSLPEACSVNIAPTTSTAMQLALGDALAMTVMDMRGVSHRELASLHPGGAIGLAFTPVSELMHGPARMPLIELHSAMPHAISAITRGCFGLVGVIDGEGHLVGVISDGDLRRHFEILSHAVAADVMTSSPKVIAPDMIARDALEFLNLNQITAAFVADETADGACPPLGIIHIHDLLRHGVQAKP